MEIVPFKSRESFFFGSVYNGNLFQAGTLSVGLNSRSQQGQISSIMSYSFLDNLIRSIKLYCINADTETMCQ